MRSQNRQGWIHPQFEPILLAEYEEEQLTPGEWNEEYPSYIIGGRGASPSEIRSTQNETEWESQWEINPEFEWEQTRENNFEFETGNGSSYEQKIAKLPPTIFSLLKSGKDAAALKMAMQNGLTDEADLTNLIFFNRHPELGGKKLVKTQLNFQNLSKEWLQIRDLIVRPNLSSRPSGPFSPSDYSNPHIPPVESPSNIKPITGYRCLSGRKCWKGPKSADIVDADAPWNKPGNRSAANYIAVLDYFNVGESDSQGTGNSIIKPWENPRYRQHKNERGGVSTYCNIYVHDVTRAMWASIPHWIPMDRKNKLNELSANDTVTWLTTKGKERGWLQIDKEMMGWLSIQISSAKAAPPPNKFYSTNLSRAGSQVALSPGINNSLITQQAYIAQQFANLGLPAVAVWKKPGGIGHVAMIRPEEESKKGKVESGMFRPRSAQAGAKNYSSGPLVFGAAALKSGAVLFYVHE